MLKNTVRKTVFLIKLSKTAYYFGPKIVDNKGL